MMDPTKPEDIITKRLREGGIHYPDGKTIVEWLTNAGFVIVPRVATDAMVSGVATTR